MGMFEMLASDSMQQILLLSFKVATLATVLNLPFALCTGWVLARHNFLGKVLLETLVQLPLVLPPVVVGYLLLILFGVEGWIGKTLASWGIQLTFHWTGAVLAAMVMAFPLMVQPVRLAFGSMDRRLESMAASLGLPPYQVFFRVSLPLALPGIMMGMVLSFCRSLSEFGATITFVGAIPGETLTLPLAIYTLLQQPDAADQVLLLVCCSVALSVFALFGNHWLTQRQARQLQDSANQTDVAHA